MKTTIDAAGRIVVPKALREREGRLEIERAPTPMALVKRRGSRVALPSRKLRRLTDEIVRDTLEKVRR